MLNKKSKILVVGSYGFIGFNLTQSLLKRGFKVRGNRFRNSHLSHSNKNFQETNFDLEKKEDCLRILEDIDIVYMCAASTSGANEIVNNPLVHVTSNIIMLVNLLEAAIKKKINRFVYISTGAVYPNLDKQFFSEDDMLKGEPFDVYYSAGWTKRYSEILCNIFSNKTSKNFSCLIIRPSNIYGPFDKFDRAKSHVTASIIRKVVENDNPLVVWGNGDQKRDLIYIDDFIDAMILVSELKFDFLEVNIASGELYSIEEILKTAMNLKNLSTQIIYDKKKPQTVEKIGFDISKLRELTNFSCKNSLIQGLKKTIDWVENNKEIAFKR